MNNINGKDLFGAAIRIVGLLSFGRGFVDLLYILLFVLGLSNASTVADFPNNNLLYGLFYLFGGLYLLRGAPLLIDFAYPEKSTNFEKAEVKENLSAVKD